MSLFLLLGIGWVVLLVVVWLVLGRGLGRTVREVHPSREEHPAGDEPSGAGSAAARPESHRTRRRSRMKDRA